MEYRNSKMNEAIAEYVHVSKYRDVLRLRYCEGMTFAEIGEVTNYSEQHVKKICYAYKDLLMSLL